MANPSVVNSYKGSATMNPMGDATVTLTVSAPAVGNVLVLFITAITAAVIAPSLTGVASWTKVASQVLSVVPNSLTAWTGLVGASGGTSLSVALSGGSSGDTCIVQAVEITGQQTGVLDGAPQTAAQSVQTGASFNCNSPSIVAMLDDDLVLAYLVVVAVGQQAGVGAGPTNGFTSISTEGVSGGANDELLAQLAAFQGAIGTYDTSQTFTQAFPSTFSNYCGSIILAVAPVSSNPFANWTAWTEPQRSPASIAMGMGPLTGLQRTDSAGNLYAIVPMSEATALIWANQGRTLTPQTDVNAALATVNAIVAAGPGW